MAQSQSSTDPPKRVRADTVWRLVSSSCEQLAESVRSTRLPAVLALTWSLVWFMALYDAHWGFFERIMSRLFTEEWAGATHLDDAARQRMETMLLRAGLPMHVRDLLPRCTHRIREQDAVVKVQDLASCELDLRAQDGGRIDSPSYVLAGYLAAQWTAQQKAQSPADTHWAFRTCAKKFRPAAADGKPLTNAELAACRARAEKAAEAAFGQVMSAHFVPLPLGIGRTSINDLAIIGPLALLLLMTWWALALQAESEAIRSFVDFGKRTRDQDGHTIVELVPQHARWQAEHLAFAFHAVRTRLFNLFRQKRRDMRISTSGTVAFPLVVVAIQLYTDLRWLLTEGMDTVFERIYVTLLLLTVVEVALIGLVVMVWVRIFRLAHRTSDVLHAWRVATEKNWLLKWDESQDQDPDVVVVDLTDARVVDRRVMQWAEEDRPPAAPVPPASAGAAPAADPAPLRRIRPFNARPPQRRFR